MYKKIFGTIGKFGCFHFIQLKFQSLRRWRFILTSDFNLFKKIKRIRFYGIETVENTKFKNQYYANENGLNSRLDEIQASILNFKLKKIDFFINKRRRIAKKYINELNNTNLKLPKENKGTKHVYHLFTVSHSKANLIKKKLFNLGIQSRSIYAYPIHEMKAYKKIIKNKKNLKISFKKSREIFSLPLYP